MVARQDYFRAWGFIGKSSTPLWYNISQTNYPIPKNRGATSKFPSKRRNGTWDCASARAIIFACYGPSYSGLISQRLKASNVFLSSSRVRHMYSLLAAYESPFHSSVWIGAGKKFSSSLPHEVLNAKEKDLKITELFHGHLTPPTAYIRDFTSLDLPFQSNSLNFHATAEWFSDDTPRADPNFSNSIPPIQKGP